HGALAGRDPLALPAGDQCAGLSGARGLMILRCDELGRYRGPAASLRVLRIREGLLPSDAAFGIGRVRRLRGCSSGVEHNLAKVGVEGSNPFARSRSSLASG